jgi:hypothetical protein
MTATTRDEREAKLREACEWVARTVILYGGSEYTAHLCAAEFGRGVREAWAKQESAK